MASERAIWMPEEKESFEFDLNDHKGRRVCWHKKSYLAHLKKRPELKRLKNQIVNALTKPYHIRNMAKGIVYYYSDVVRYSRFGEVYMKVVVKYVGFFRKVGYIKTSYLVRSIDD